LGYGRQQAASSSGPLCRREMAQHREVSGAGCQVSGEVASGWWLVASHCPWEVGQGIKRKAMGRTQVVGH